MCYQYNGYPVHNAHVAHVEILHEMFSERWIGRGGYIRWPVMFSWFESSELFSIENVENIYNDISITQENMRERILDAFINSKMKGQEYHLYIKK